jgi:hypothetical protein
MCILQVVCILARNMENNDECKFWLAGEHNSDS